jgi:hypothetical protein
MTFNLAVVADSPAQVVISVSGRVQATVELTDPVIATGQHPQRPGRVASSPRASNTGLPNTVLHQQTAAKRF